MLRLLVLAGIFISAHCAAMYGQDFYIGTMRNYQGNTASYKLHLSTLSSSATYSIQDINGDFIVYNNVQYMNLPVSKEDGTVVTIDPLYVTNSNAERAEGLHLTTSDPVSVLVVNYRIATISEYPAYPKQKFSVLQYEYYVAAPKTDIVPSSSSEVLLVGTEDGTTITITPTVNIYVPSDFQDLGSQQELVSAGQTKKIILNRLQTYYFGQNNGADLTGTSVVSDKPLTVISGNECGNVPSTKAFCEHTEEQIPPTVTWGKEFLLRSFTGKNDDTYYLIVSAEDDNTLQHNCGSSEVVASKFDLAGHQKTVTLALDTNCYLRADKPILVTQMMTGGSGSTGDPAVSIIPPFEQYTNEVVFHTPEFDQNLEDNHMHIVMRKTDTIYFDNAPIDLAWEEIIGLNNDVVGYSAEWINLEKTVHHIYSENGQPFYVLVYGYTGSSLAGYTFVANVGLSRQLVGGKLQAVPWYGSILGNVPFLVKGPTFATGDIITCQFNELSLPCTMLNEEFAMCVSPRLTFTRRITLRLYHNGEKYATDTRFYSLPISSGSGNQASILENNFFLTSGQSVTLVWDNTAVIPSAATSVNVNNLLVNITLYEVKGEDSNIVQKISQLATGILNTGETVITIPTWTSENHIDFCGVLVTLYDAPELPTIISDVSEIGVWGTDVWVAFSEQPDQFNQMQFDRCNEWANTETEMYPDIKEILLSRTLATPCPPTAVQARTPNSGLVKDTRERIVQYFHPKADECYVQRTITGANLGVGNECCYSGGSLIVGPGSGGSINKVDPRGTDFSYWDTVRAHFKEDIVPYLFCCTGIETNCQAYYDRRPSDDGSRYRPPVPACVYGDPHIVTLDLHKYTFNGKGEFILVETPDFDPSFTVHGRMVQVKDENDNDAKATVFSAIVAKQGDSDAVQFELQGSGDSLSIVTYVDGEEIDFSELRVQEFNNVTVTDTRNNTLNAIFSSGAYVTVAELNGLISTLIVYLPDMYRGKTQGLMGNYNNDTSDDLTRKGTTLPLSLNAPLKQIHDWFGMSYIVASEEDGIFSYNNGDSFGAYYDPDFVPLFEAQFATDDLEQQANTICGDDEFCLFDIAVSGKTELGMATKKGSDDFVMLQELSKPIVCNPSCVNGACIDTNVCSCSEGYFGIICDQMNITDCTSFNPCLNGATCGRLAGSVVCMCSQGYIGYYCEKIDPVNPPTSSSTQVPPTTMVSATTTTSQRGGGSQSMSTTTTRGRTSSTTGTNPTSRPGIGPLSVEEGAGVIITVVVIVAIVIIVIVVVAIVLLSKRKRNIAKKYPIENEMVNQPMGKANPAYENMEEEGENIYDNHMVDDDDDEKKLVD